MAFDELSFDIYASDVRVQFENVVQIVVDREGEIGVATAKVNDMDGLPAQGVEGIGFIQQAQILVDLLELALHIRADPAILGHDTHSPEERRGILRGEESAFLAVV